jgi:hypothetical protein
LRALPSTGYTGFDENLKAIFDLDQQRDAYGDRVAKRMSNIRKDLEVIKEKFCELGFSKDDFGLD